VDYDGELLLGKKLSLREAATALEKVSERLQVHESFDTASLEELLRALAEELGLKAGQLFGLLRVAITGRTTSPPLFQTMAVLGKQRCMGRIESAVRKLR
jgi:glutamyl-tRNA synthetase